MVQKITSILSKIKTVLSKSSTILSKITWILSKLTSILSHISAIHSCHCFSNNNAIFIFGRRCESIFIIHRFLKWPEQLKDRLNQILLIRYDLAPDVLDAFEPIIKLSRNKPFQETYFQLLRTAMYRP